MTHHSLESFHSSQPDGNLVGILRILLVLVTSHTELAQTLGKFRKKIPDFFKRLEAKNVLLPINDGKNNFSSVKSSVPTHQNGNNSNSGDDNNSSSNNNDINNSSSISSSNSIDYEVIDGVDDKEEEEQDVNDDDNDGEGEGEGEEGRDGDDLLSFLYRNCLFPAEEEKLVSSPPSAANVTNSCSTGKCLHTRTPVDVRMDCANYDYYYALFPLNYFRKYFHAFHSQLNL